MTSIKQNPDISMAASVEPALAATNILPGSIRSGIRVPDFRNLGVCLRILVMVNLFAIVTALLQTPGLMEALVRLAELSMFTQPLLLLSFIVLYLLTPYLRAQPYWRAVSCILVLELLLSSLMYGLASYLFGAESLPDIARGWLLTLLCCGSVLYYFNLRQRALTPALAEARLQALQARIRPHFLFNSINAVLSLIRSQPARAEAALEDMADLFRVLMADNRELVPLAQELALSRQYLALEKLRLDDRLQIVWQIDSMPPDALIPPLVLQPLLENAVYHGIEPMPHGGEIIINIYSNRNEVHLLLSNPYPAQGGHQTGNKMALTNIRERLALHFDAEAALTSRIQQGRYEVHIAIPYHAAGAGK